MSGKITLTALPVALREHGINLTYSQCWSRVVAGTIPAERNGRSWLVETADLPRIAESLAQR